MYSYLEDGYEKPFDCPIIQYEGQSKITEPYLITFELSKMDIYLDDISLSYMSSI